MNRVLVTGGAGFIGSHLVDFLLAQGWQVTTIDCFDDFYDPQTKRQNIQPHLANSSYRLIEADICDLNALQTQLHGHQFDLIIHLAARAGVRPSIANPFIYQQVNVNGTQNLLEIARQMEIKKFIFGSSSSVYGVNPNLPWREDDYVLKPISPYASTKVSAELLGHVYSHLYGIQFLALRFFTVYGPRQRPDLAIHKFAKLMTAGKKIPVYGDGSSSRDYTFVGDIVQGIIGAIAYDQTSYEIINLGNNRTVSLIEMIKGLEQVFEVEANLEFMANQPGDVSHTFARVEKAKALLDYTPNTDFITGLEHFRDWLLTGAMV
ncbi:UDP-glucuronate 4-epimerase [Thalassoporum mexicanum PCC 7367]|uniref:GDP-mannose 4,6-dehydratase n=1 Tax=Thalassoporum mexicanum TaxID=3457544 RepID=UPI00029FA3AB|nr:GDP-mannose 4,6-dehydratase [Pseudanabaena sp. PCC 7367]AFY71848.1 UDP-glucuronate 4-epimerase [Pseudanabaena sp. PCC 7367]